jgi:hypothetical protein
MSKRAALLVVFAILAMVGAQAAFACPGGTFSCYCNGEFSGCFHGISDCAASCEDHPVPNILGIRQGPTSKPPAQHRPIVQRPTAADVMLVRIMAPAN